MFKEHSKRDGVSAIVGGLIILAILFTMIIPLIILIQNSYAIFLNESNSRRIFDTDRISESLQVEVSRNETTRQLILKLSNNGPVYVNISRIWAIDVSRQKSIPGEGPCLNRGLPGLPPGKDNITNVQQCVHGFTGYVQFIIVTERGRLFSSNKVYLKEGWLSDIIFPYTLTVSIINMKKGRLYEVYVKPLGAGEVSPEKFTHKATAANENVTVAFGIFPGNYSVELYENNRLVQIPEDNPQRIKVPETTAVIFTLSKTPYSVVNLKPIINAPNLVNKKKTEYVSVEIYVQLPKQSDEPVEITYIKTVPISIRGGGVKLEDCSIVDPGYILRPGEIGPIGVCVLDITGASDFEIIVDMGNIQGIGTITSAKYINAEGKKRVNVVAN